MCNNAVINVKNQDEFNNFLFLMEILGLQNVSYLRKIAVKDGFEKGFCYNGGVKYCNPEDICFEYKMGKGFSYSCIQMYKNSTYNDYVICTLDEIKDATGYAIKIDKTVIDKPRNSLFAYYRFSTEEKAKRFYCVDRLEKIVENIDAYTPLEGFYDLRNFELPIEKFRELWKIQLYLKEYQTNKSNFSSLPDLWEKLKDLSSNYQRELFSYPQKCSKSDEIDFELEMEKEK